MIRLLRLRRLVQVAVLLLLAALPWLNRDGFTGMKGSLFAFDFFGLPFADPLGAVQIGLSGIIPGWRLIAGALVVLAVALCLGRIFCSWLCPFGFLSELVHAIRGRRPQKPLKHGFRSRAVIALIGLAGIRSQFLICCLFGFLQCIRTLFVIFFSLCGRRNFFLGNTNFSFKIRNQKFILIYFFLFLLNRTIKLRNCRLYRIIFRTRFFFIRFCLFQFFFCMGKVFLNFFCFLL